MTEAETLLRNFYRKIGGNSNLYLLVNPSGEFLVHQEDEDAVLSVFLEQEAVVYYQTLVSVDCQIHKITLTGLWSIIPRLGDMVEKFYKMPLRINVRALGEGEEFLTVDTLYSVHTLFN